MGQTRYAGVVCCESCFAIAFDGSFVGFQHPKFDLRVPGALLPGVDFCSLEQQQST